MQEMILHTQKRGAKFKDCCLVTQCSRTPGKFSTTNFFNFLRNKHQNWLSGTWKVWKGTKSGNMTVADRFMAGGAIMALPDKIGLKRDFWKF